ncbi:MAG: hypothetical protein ABSH00_18925 [Bryobacteraceae bacterium]|jgi:hypothetical protein
MKILEAGKKIGFIGLLLPVFGVATAVAADQNALVVTAANAAQNQLLVYTTGGQLVQTVSTQGKGGVSGNAGGIETNGDIVAVVNFGSQNVSIFEHDGDGMRFKYLVPSVSSPVSVAFGAGHLYILGTTKVESHQIWGSDVSSSPDGVVTLLVADGSSAQVGVVENQLIITEKSNMIETVDLLSDGAVGGAPAKVLNIPSNVNTPFGLVTRGNDAYVTIAHSNEISLVRNGAILTITGSGTQSAPCWLALVGPFLFSSNSPSMSVSRYAVYGQKIVQDAAVAATLNGDPTDIASGGGMVAVIDGNGTVSHLSIFSVDEDGNLTLLQAADTLASTANGVAIVRHEY